MLLLQLWLLGTIEPPLHIIRSPLRPLRCRWRGQLGLRRLRRWRVCCRGCCRFFAEPAALGARQLHIPANNDCVSAPSLRANNIAALAQQCCCIGTRSRSPWICVAFALLGPVCASRRAVRARRRVLCGSRRQRRQKEAAAAHEDQAVGHATRPPSHRKLDLGFFPPPPTTTTTTTTTTRTYPTVPLML